MIYEEFPEWKELKKQKKYKEATEKLMYELAVNLMRIHNLYSDKKYDLEKEYYIAYGCSYGKNRDRFVEKRLENYTIFSVKLQTYRIWIKNFEKDDDVPYECKFIMSKLLKEKKEIIKAMKK